MRVRTLIGSAAVLLFGIVYTAPREVVYAQTAGAPAMMPAVAALVSAAAAAQGFVSGDPRIAETVAAIGAAAAGFASSAASAAGTAVAAVPWVTVAALAGIGFMLAAVPTSLGDDTLSKWTFNSDGTVTTQTSSSSTSPFPAIANGMNLWCVYSYCGGTALAAAQAFAQANYPGNGSNSASASSCDSANNCTIQIYSSSGSPVGSTVVTPGNSSVAYSGGNCPSGLMTGSTCMTYIPPPSEPPVTGSPTSAAGDTSGSDAADPLNPVILADTVNALWMDAAQGEGYAGLPYPVNAPVTPAQAGTIETQLGSLSPTVGSVTSGAGTLSGVSSSAPFAGTGATSGSGASAVPVATNPGSGAQVNLGSDPGIGSPGLESTPTAAQILAPLLNLLPDFRSYAMPAHTGTCPEPSFAWAGTTYTWTKHCELIEQNRSLITQAFVVAFSLAAALIVLTA